MNVDFNIDNDHINVPIKKYNLISLLSIVLAVFILGCYLVINPSAYVATSGYRYRHPWEIFLLGSLCIATCGPCVAILLYRIIDTRPGLKISLEGITNRTSLFQTDLIEWSDINKIDTENDKYPVYVIVYINNPAEYVQGKKLFARYMASSNYTKYGSPIVIDAYQLKCGYPELCAFLEDTLGTYQKAARNT
ncbi:MAG: STM3941 family protein [Mucilaginibacter sp.]